MSRFFFPLSSLIRAAALGALALVLAGPAGAVPVDVIHADKPLSCDPLFVPDTVDELGIGPPLGGFPIDELISATATSTPLVACVPTDSAAAANTLVTMTNLTTRSFVEVWYVADPNVTFISNIDGFVTSLPGTVLGEAFRIDSLASDPGGINHPLVFGDNGNDIFEPGESWGFIIDDYGSLGLASAFLSAGLVGGASVPDPLGSTGSIIAIELPEPLALALLGIGLAVVGTRRRSTA